MFNAINKLSILSFTFNSNLPYCNDALFILLIVFPCEYILMRSILKLTINVLDSLTLLITLCLIVSNKRLLYTEECLIFVTFSAFCLGGINELSSATI